MNRDDRAWSRGRIFFTALAGGALVGAAAALLLAPRSGEETRRRLADGARILTPRLRDALGAARRSASARVTPHREG